VKRKKIMKKKCKKCKNKNTESFVFEIWPREWYHHFGPKIFLCKNCIKKLKMTYPKYVISPKECEELVKKFLTQQY